MTYCKRAPAFMGAVFFGLAGTAAAQSPDGWFLGCKASRTFLDNQRRRQSTEAAAGFE
jgi:hypothetical protein